MRRIAISEEAYERLAAMKREDESFSDLLLRLTGTEQDPLDGFGALAETEFADHVEDPARRSARTTPGRVDDPDTVRDDRGRRPGGGWNPRQA